MIDRLQTLVTKEIIARIVRNSLINAAGETALHVMLMENLCVLNVQNITY